MSSLNIDDISMRFDLPNGDAVQALLNVSLDIKEGDVVVIFDVRRYENTTLQLTQMCHDKGAEIVLFTDHWRSPIHRIAALTFTARIAVPSAWDSCLPVLMLLECTIAAVQEAMWETAKDRTDALEAAFDETKLFRKFI